MYNFKFTLTPEIHKLTAEIDEFKGKWEMVKNLAPEHLKQLKKTATIESVASSTRIEGVALSNSQVEALLTNIKVQSFGSRDEQEVAGYAEAMDLVFQAYEELSLTENRLKQLHTILLKYSDKDERHRGEYKKLSNNVGAFDQEGNQIAVIFKTVTPFDTPLAMEELIKWTRKAFEEQTDHPLLITAAFIVVFLAIHPFQDGNGRLSRILTTLLLLQTGYAYIPYSSLESVIEENKDLYYRALRRTQSSLKEEAPNWESWFVFFLRAMKKQKDNLEKRTQQEEIPVCEMSLTMQKILSVFDDQPQLSSSEIEKIVKINKNTLKVQLRKLVEAKILSRHGKGRATWYCKKL